MFKKYVKYSPIIFVFLALFWLQPAQAAGWFNVSSGITTNLNAIDFIDYYTGYAVGDSGVILKKTSNSWSTPQNSGVTVNLHGVDIVYSSTAFVVGAGGTILKTTSGGASWVQQTSGATVDLNAVKFVVGNANIGYAVGKSGTILKTTNGGAAWIALTSGTTNDLYDIGISPESSSVVWAAGKNGTVLYSDNAGSTWTKQTFLSGTGLDVKAIEVLSSNTALALIYTTYSRGIVRTTNGGTSWSEVYNAGFNTLSEIDLASNGSLGFAVGNNGTILKTSDSGVNWAVSSNSQTSSLYDVAAMNDRSLAVGAEGAVLEYDETLPTAPGNLTKTTSDGDNTPAFQWSGSADPSGYSGSYSGSGVVKYEYAIDGGNYVNNGLALTATLSNALSNGPHVVQARAVDAVGNVGNSASLTFLINVITDFTPPSGNVVINGGASATNSASVNLSLSCSDNVSCSLMQISTDGILDAESFGLYTTTKAITLSGDDGAKTVKIKFKDGADNVSAEYSDDIILDTFAPSVGLITPASAQATVAQSFTASYTDNAAGVASCNFYVDSVDQGSMTLSGNTAGTASHTYSFSNTAGHALQVRCSDAAGNVGLGTLTTVSISAAPAVAADTAAPSTPTGTQKVSNDADATPTFTWNTASDNVGATNYLVQIDNGSLIDNGGSTSYTVPGNLTNGSHTFKVLAKDAAGNTSNVATYNFTVNTSAPVVSCPLTMEKAYKIPTFKAVYYITTDCTKRPFKNGPSFFTYFDSWSEVITTTKTILDSVANDLLGFTPAGPKYDPKYGALVKIVTDPKVYLLLGTEKYWIISESVFTGLKYDWKWIEDVDPGLLNKYSIGSEITYTDHHPNYTIIKYAGFANTYRLEPDPDDYSKQVKRWIKNEKVFNALKFRWDRIVTVPNSEVYKDGKIMDESEVNL